MAKQEGPIMITGRVGGLSFYKCGDAYYVRGTGGPSDKQIKHAPAFERVRENLSEFGAASQAGALLRRQLRRMLPAGEKNLYRRVTQLMTQIKEQDNKTRRGQRRVDEGLKRPEGRSLLYDFAFNSKQPLQKVLRKEVLFNTAHEIVLPGFIPGQHLQFPEGADTARITALRLHINFKSGSCTAVPYETLTLSRNQSPERLCLRPLEQNTAEGLTIYFLQICFFTEVQGQLLAFENGALDALGCIGVDPELVDESLVCGEEKIITKAASVLQGKTTVRALKHNKRAKRPQKRLVLNGQQTRGY